MSDLVLVPDLPTNKRDLVEKLNSLFKKLEERKSAGNLRRLQDTKDLVDFVSNDYLGLSRSLDLFNAIENYSYTNITNINGSTGSRLLAGNADETVKLENKLAAIFKSERALLFNSGYVANLGLLSSIPQRRDTIIYDQLSHVCIKEGAKLSQAKRFSFLHNDCNDLEKKLKKATGQIFVLIESVYSMDGDLAALQDIINVCQKYEARLIIDEAHSTGLYGSQGEGKVCELGLEKEFFARVYTFGKAMGVHGACVAGSQELIDYLINFARPFIYTTALPVHSIFSIDAAFDHIAAHPELQTRSKQRIEYFNSQFDSTVSHLDIAKLPSKTPIQPICIPGNKRVKAIANTLQQEGLDVRPILSPTVPEGTERLRVTLHTFNSSEEIKKLIDVLNSQL